MISLLLYCPLSVVQSVRRLLKFVLSPSSITRGYCHGDYSVKNSWKVTPNINNSPRCRSLFAPSWAKPNNSWNQRAPQSRYWLFLVNITAGLTWIHEMLLTAVFLIQKQGLLGYAAVVRPGWETTFVRLFRRGRSGSTTRELGGLPVFFQHANRT